MRTRKFAFKFYWPLVVKYVTALVESACNCNSASGICMLPSRVLGLGVDNALSENILFHMNEAAKRDTEHSWIQFKNFCKLPWTQHFGSYIIASISVFQIILNIWYQNRCSWRNWSVLNYKNKQKHADALIFYKGSKFFPTFVTRFLISLEQEQS